MLAISFVACGNAGPAASSVAATVGGVDVLESDVTARIETFRIDSTTGETLDDIAWAKMLAGASFTPESLREYVIKQQFAMPILILQEAAAAGIEPDTAAIDEQITMQKSGLDDDEEAWANYLTQMGFSSEDAYRQYLEAQNVTTPLLEVKAPAVDPTPEEIAEYVAANAGMYAGKRSSAIYFAVDETNTAELVRPIAEEALTRLNDGEDFAALVTEYSDDTTSAENGGDMGWSVFSSVPQQYTDALATLAVGDTSDIVETDYGFFIIRVTDEFTANEDGSVDAEAVPEDIQTMLSESLKSNNSATAQQAFFDGLLESDLIEINPMPSGLPYDVDMALADEPDPEDPTVDDGTGNEQPQSTGELVIVDTLEGEGVAAEVGDTVSVHYILSLTDGTVLESSYDSGQPFTFTIGTGTVIPGWDQGIPGMKVGGTRQLTVPPELAYGETGSGSVPPNATLIFEVELVSINA
jgi:parvulin-like peptidyl-prolyl isomerase